MTHLSPTVQVALLCCVVAATAHALATISAAAASSEEEIGISLVWAYGFVTAATTGLGALPFLLVGRIVDVWLGCSNAAAAGMMLGASAILLGEGYEADVDLGGLDVPLLGGIVGARVAAGLALGLIFIVATRVVFAEKLDDLQLGSLSHVDSRKALLVMVVMTLHSFSEGVGIGVSFHKRTGATLGPLISISLAVHNVPEGLAVALSLVPRGVSARAAILLAVASSLPQPVCAIPAFCLVEAFVVVLPTALGFAAGGMIGVALVELLPDARRDAHWSLVAAVSLVAGAAQIGMHMALRDQAQILGIGL